DPFRGILPGLYLIVISESFNLAEYGIPDIGIRVIVRQRSGRPGQGKHQRHRKGRDNAGFDVNDVKPHADHPYSVQLLINTLPLRLRIDPSLLLLRPNQSPRGSMRGSASAVTYGNLYPQ